MITYVDSDAEAKKKPRTMKSQSQLETYSNRLKVMRSFQINSSLPLQFVVTRTFLSLVDRVRKALTIDDDKLDIYELEEEEYILRENLKNELANTEESNNNNDDDTFNPSFNFLIKNQLGVDFEIESISGFKVKKFYIFYCEINCFSFKFTYNVFRLFIHFFQFYNINFKPDQSPNDRYINKIILKNNESYPITQSFTSNNNMKHELSHSTLEEQTQNQYQIMRFKIDVSISFQANFLFEFCNLKTKTS